MPRVTIVGGGFAGVEAAWAAARLGVPVRLYEMRPKRATPAHKTGWLAELVCSNSFKSMLPTTPSGQLKWEMERLGSLVIPTAREFAVPAGEALAVDREAFAKAITARIELHPLIEVVREEVAAIPPARPLIIATGPLTSDALAGEIARLTGKQHLYFYDAVSPIVDASTIDYDRVFFGSRRDKGDPAYINCPFTKAEYERFWEAIVAAECVPLHEFEEPRFFEGCTPLEALAARGKDTLRFGPLKPIGLTDPRTGKRPYAVLQLRPENNERTLYSLVACQTRMKWGEQKRVFRLVPGLENAEFVRYGVVHRNTYLDSPRLLQRTLQFCDDGKLIFAGQLVGVEGYLESAASGIIAGLNAARLALGKPAVAPPRETVLGALNFFSDKPRQYAPAELRLAKGIADLVAVAVDRIRLREASLSAQRRTERVAQINGALLTASDEFDIVRTFAEYIEEMDAASAALSYFETTESPHLLRTVAVCDRHGARAIARVPQPALPSDEFAAVLRQQTLTLIEDVQQDATLSARERAILLEAGVRAMATLLLNSGGAWSGVFSIHWRQPRAFSADDRAVLEAVLPSLTAVVARRQLWLKQAETLERLRQMDRLKDEFLSNMSHELRTPLNAVIGLSDVILQGMDGELTPRLQQDIQTIHDAGQQLLAIVNDVLDIAKIESGTLTLRLNAIDLRQPLQEALKTAYVMAASKQLTLSAHLPEQPLMVQADANRMRQVALNLLSNAIKFTDAGNVRLYAYAQSGQVVFCVQDEGIGIAPEHHALIFEQFRQVEGSLHRRKGGAGLGLAISKRLVELHGGRIWLESALGKGATFYVSLPSL